MPQIGHKFYSKKKGVKGNSLPPDCTEKTPSNFIVVKMAGEIAP